MNINFEMVLFASVIVTGSIVLVDFMILALWRRSRSSYRPAIVDYARVLFPILLLILICRMFFFAPYRVPTGSLEPTVMPGDVVLAKKGVLMGAISRGDVIAFRHPVFGQAVLMKRVVGMPGDDISYINKHLVVNGVTYPLKYQGSSEGRYSAHSASHKVAIYQEDMGGIKHEIYLRPDVKAANFYHLHVPKGDYFVMGDNRDSSDDSRYWGFVSKADILGKAKLVWWSWNSHNALFFDRVRWDRIGTRIS